MRPSAAAAGSPREPLLAIRGLRTYFHLTARRRFVRAVDGLDLELYPGETLALVGESGSGKSAAMLSVMGLVSGRPGIVAGQIRFRPRGGGGPLDLLEDLPRYARWSAGPPLCIEKREQAWRRASERRLRPLRGRQLAMIFQNARGALHPYFTVGQQLQESLRRGDPQLSARAARDAAADWLARVHLDAPRRRLDDYPHALSGGMCQRVLIAIALAANPALLIADEPTTGLDATIQARVLELLGELQASTGVSTILVTHDIGAARQLADRAAVLYAGRVLEVGAAREVLGSRTQPKHPYTRGLLDSLPDRDAIRKRVRLRAIAGDVPDLAALPPGCAFAERCVRRLDLDDEPCESELPALEPVTPAHAIRCFAVTASRPKTEVEP